MGTLLFVSLIVVLLAIVLGAGGYGVRPYWNPAETEVVTTSPSEAAKAAEDIGYPVVMKLASPDFAHKSEAGLVRLGVGTRQEAEAAFDELLEAARRADKGARVDGVLVQQTAGAGIEMIVGAIRDALTWFRSNGYL